MHSMFRSFTKKLIAQEVTLHSIVSLQYRQSTWKCTSLLQIKIETRCFAFCYIQHIIWHCNWWIKWEDLCNQSSQYRKYRRFIGKLLRMQLLHHQRLSLLAGRNNPHGKWIMCTIIICAEMMRIAAMRKQCLTI